MEGVRVGDAVPALDGQLRLHGEGGEGGRAGHIHRPVAHGLDGEHALNAGHTVKVAGQAQGHGEVDALVLAAAEEDVVHLDGGRAAVAVPRLGAVPHVGGGLKGGRVGVHGVGVMGDLLLQGTQIVRRVRPSFDQVLLGLVQSGGLRGGLLGRGHQEGQVQAAAEADDAAYAIHIAQLAVLELEEQAQQALGGLAHAGPQEGDVAVLVPVAAGLIGGEGIGLPVFDGGEAAPAGPHRGAHPGDGEGGVKVHLDGPVLVGDGHLAVPDVQAVVEGDDVVLFPQGHGGVNGAAAFGFLGEGAPELQQDGAVAQLLVGVFVFFFRFVSFDRVGVISRLIPFHRHHAVAVVAVLRVVGDLEAQGGGGDVGLRGVGVVDGQLVLPHGQLLGQHHLGGVVLLIDDKGAAIDCNAALSVNLCPIGAGKAEGVAAARQHIEIGAGEV